MPSEHAKLSASSSERWMHCPRSVALNALIPEEPSPYAAEGTKAHAFAEKLLKMYAERGRTDFAPCETKSVTIDGAEQEVPQEMQNAILDYVEEVKETFEALKLKDANARMMVEQKINYERWVPEGFGTSDCLIIASGVCHVFDLKYGMGVQVGGKGNSQLRLYALGAYEELDWEADIQSFETHIVQPRLHWKDGETISKEDLLAWGETVKPLAKLANEDKGELKSGDWCRFCRANALCKRRALDVLEAMRDAISKGSDALGPDLMNEESLSAMARLEGPLTKLVKDAQSRLLSDIIAGKGHAGWKAVAGRSTREWDDAEQLKRELQRAGYLVKDISEPEELLSPNKLKKAIKADDYKGIALKHIRVNPGNPQLAGADDPREEYHPMSAEDDFKGMIASKGGTQK